MYPQIGKHFEKKDYSERNLRNRRNYSGDQNLSKVSKEPDYDLFERAEISTARAWLALGETEKAREQLLFIAENTSHSYKKEAQKILDKLDSFWRKLP